MATAHNWKKDDRVVIFDATAESGRAPQYHGCTGVVLKANPKMVRVQLDGGAGVLNCYYGFLHPEGTEVPNLGDLRRARIAEMPIPHIPGTVVECTGSASLSGLFVVLTAGRLSDKQRVCRIGNGATYWNIPTRQLREVKVNVEKIPE